MEDWNVGGNIGGVSTAVGGLAVASFVRMVDSDVERVTSTDAFVLV